MAQVLMDLVYSVGNCLNCFPGSPTLKINGRSFKILRLLGEGGFSYVYLVEDTSNGEQLALKKIRCPFGAESVAQAMREVDAYRLFAHVPGVIHMVDHAVAKDSGGGVTSGIGAAGDDARTVYVLLPYYRRGNLQDMINANLVSHSYFPESKLMVLFLGVCRALRRMHRYKKGPAVRMDVGDPEDGEPLPPPPNRSEEGSSTGRNGKGKDRGKGKGQSKVESKGSKGTGKGKGKAKYKARGRGGSGGSGGIDVDDDDDEDDDDDDTDDEDDDDDPDHDRDDDDDRPLMHAENRVAGGAIESYAHRDIKPGNIMIDDAGSSPILMDLGSLAASPLPITSPSMALAMQDAAAEHSTMPYRAPELFDVRTGTVVDTAVDIWSLGCTLYACLVGKSPFELRSDETGGSLSLCVLGGDWRFPDEGGGAPVGGSRRVNSMRGGEVEGPAGAGGAGASSGGTDRLGDAVISEPVKEVVRRCLRVEPSERPDIDELIEMVERVIDDLAGDES